MRRVTVAHLASSIAAALPIPLAAPVMTATLPACITGWTSLSTGESASKRLCEGVVPRMPVGGRRGDGPRSRGMIVRCNIAGVDVSYTADRQGRTNYHNEGADTNEVVERCMIPSLYSYHHCGVGGPTKTPLHCTFTGHSMYNETYPD